MSVCQSNPPAPACPPTVADLRCQARERLDEIIASCSATKARPRSSTSRRTYWGSCGRWDAC